jgi:C4-type Zn-finger protein
MTCPVCQRQFDPANRAGPTTPEGSIVQMRYCSEQCARKAENARYYQERKKKVEVKGDNAGAAGHRRD